MNDSDRITISLTKTEADTIFKILRETEACQKWIEKEQEGRDQCKEETDKARTEAACIARDIYPILSYFTVATLAAGFMEGAIEDHFRPDIENSHAQGSDSEREDFDDIDIEEAIDKIANGLKDIYYKAGRIVMIDGEGPEFFELEK